jgi:hypothetical protein
VRTENNIMVIFGGTVYRNDVAKYDITTDTWLSFTVTGTPPAGRISHSAVLTSDGIMIIYGGTAGVTVFSDIAKYDVNTDTWLDVSNIPAGTSRRSHRAILTSNNKMV